MNLLKFVAVVAFLAIQLAAFEFYERVYYRFEDRYSGIVNRLKVVPLTQVFDDEAFEALREAGLGEITYVADELGFRSLDIDYDHKRGARILFIGSYSMGWGTGVPVEQTFPHAFGRELRKLRPDAEFEVINANRMATPVDVTLRQIEDVLHTRIQPDVVILGSYILTKSYLRHAGETLERRVFGEDLEAGRSETMVVMNGTSIVTRLPHSELWYQVYSRSVALSKFLAYIDVKMSEYVDVEEMPAVSQVGYLRDLHAYLESFEIQLVVVTVPQLGGEHNELRTLVNQELVELCAELGIPYLSIDAVYPPKQHSFVRDGHYSAESNAVIGRFIAEFVDRKLDEDFDLRGR